MFIGFMFFVVGFVGLLVGYMVVVSGYLRLVDFFLGVMFVEDLFVFCGWFVDKLVYCDIWGVFIDIWGVEYFGVL